MATLIKNHTTGNWYTVNKDYSVAFGYPGQLIDFAGPAENFTHQGWLLCDGTEYNAGDYPALYEAIGNTYGGTAGSTFCVPDYREAVRVGAGASTRSAIASHDVYDVGQFKDDQEQVVTGDTYIGDGNVAITVNNTSGAFKMGDRYQLNSVNGTTARRIHHLSIDTSRVARTGITTHGKQIGVNTFIHV